MITPSTPATVAAPIKELAFVLETNRYSHSALVKVLQVFAESKTTLNSSGL